MRKQIKALAFVYMMIAAFAVQSSAAPREVRNWTRGIGLQSNFPDLKLLPFYVLGVGELGAHLYGTCIYRNERETPHSDRVTLEVQTDGEEFWAIVTLQVGDDVNGPWEMIGSSARGGEVIKLKVDSAASSPQLKVDLEAYRPFIEKHKFGRILLKSGEGAVFELADLQRPKEGE
jgi:hypothetical protein